ncbi:MAG: hypothetical protein WC262_11115 [Bacteroidales bacterium]|jgi:hypothetical protein
MAGYRWSSKRVGELLEELSDNQKNFKTLPSGRAVKDAHGYKEYPNGMLRIDGAYGGVKLVYQLPYSSGITEVSPGGFVSSGKLADFLMALGSSGLKVRFNELQKRWKPSMKARFEREKARAQART